MVVTLDRRVDKIELSMARLTRHTVDDDYSHDSVGWVKDMFSFQPDDWQADVLTSTANRLLLNITRQGGKSTTAALLALHVATYQPGSLILMVSPSLRQSGELFRKFRDFFEQLPNRPKLREDNKLSVTLENGTRVVSLPGSEQTIRGFSSVDLLIEDEAARVADDLFYATRPMLAVSGGRHVLMSTPFGKRGHFWQCWNSGDWENIKIRADECPRITAEFLEQEQQVLGNWWYSQEYNCEFLDSQNAIFTFDLLNRAREEVSVWNL